MIMTKLLIYTEAIQVWPQQNERFAIGPVSGDCIQHIINQEGFCTHIVMDDIYVVSSYDLTDVEFRTRLSDFGVVECPVVPNRFCNIQFEDGIYCEACKHRTQHENSIFANQECQRKCPIFEDDRILTCWIGADDGNVSLEDTCRKCAVEAERFFAARIKSTLGDRPTIKRIRKYKKFKSLIVQAWHAHTNVIILGKQSEVKQYHTMVYKQ